MEMRAYEYRIFPTPKQEEQFNKTLGLCRVYWNTVLTAKNENNKALIEGYHKTFEKYRPEALEWMKEIDSVPLAQMWSDIRVAFNSFFSSVNGTRKGKFVKPPKFKSKKNLKDGFRYIGRGEFRNGKLWLTNKLGLIDGNFSSYFCEGKVKSSTIKRTATGKWFVKICVEKKETEKVHNGEYIGIDWNCKDDSFVTMSDGTKVKCPRFLRRKEKHLAKLQKTMARRYIRGAEKQSNNYQKARMAVARLHETVSWQRKDWLHKLSRELANKYEFVVVENINLQNMAENLYHGKAVGDQGFGMLRSMLAYKTKLIKVPAHYTSQTCNICGSRNTKLTLNDCEWKCQSCGANHDRDINAAINIMNTGKNRSGNFRNQNACGEPSSSVKQESLKPSMLKRETNAA